jgi:hypothetical protein
MSGIPFFITHAMRATLRSMGFSDEAMSRMTPAEAHQVIEAAQDNNDPIGDTTPSNTPNLDWLAEHQYGERDPDQPHGRKGNGQDRLLLEPWWRDPATIPRRQTLFGHHYTRRHIGATIGAGGRAKTTLGACESISMAVGRNLLTGEPLPHGPLRVWVLNAEEDQDELDRRFAATCQYYRITQADLGGRLFVQSIRKKPWRLASLVKNVATLDQQLLGRMRDFIIGNQIDVFMIDPFISFHAVNESANADMDLLIKEGLGGVAEETNSACEIFHHPGKPKPGQETTVEDGRGASAIIWAVRSARVLNFMTPDEAKKIGITEDTRRRHIRVANGKANMGPVGNANWIKIEVENLSNGDVVACTTLWKPPNPFEGVTVDTAKVAQKVSQGGAYRADPQAKDWFGYAIAPHLTLMFGMASTTPQLTWPGLSRSSKLG